MTPEKIDPHHYPGPLEELEKENKLKGQEVNQNRIFIIIAIGIALLIAGGVAIAFFALQGGEIDTDFIENPEDLAAFIPFWIAVFIPLIAIKKKAKPKIQIESRIRIALVIIGILSVFGIVAYLTIKGPA